MSTELSSNALFRIALAASADMYDTNPATDSFKLRSFKLITFFVHHGTGAVGEATLTVEACSDAAGSNAEAIPFNYRMHAAGGPQSPLQTATVAGVSIVAGSDQIVIIEVDRDDGNIPAGKDYIRVQTNEDTDGPVAGAILAMLSRPTSNPGDWPDVQS